MVRRFLVVICVFMLMWGLMVGIVYATGQQPETGSLSGEEESLDGAEPPKQGTESDTSESPKLSDQPNGVQQPEVSEAPEQSLEQGKEPNPPNLSDQPSDPPSPWQLILDLDDPSGDDYGPGTYLYPTHEQFAPYQGLLDLEHFKIEATQERVRFQVRFGQINNIWNGPLGFSHQLIQIYIDHQPGGGTAPLFPGAKVVFSPKASWDTLLKVTGWGVYFFDSSDRPGTKVESYQEAEVVVLDDGQTIQIELPFTDWTNFEDLDDGSYYLLVGAQDGFGPDNYREVREEVSEWYFGGGDPSGYSSNVIDILTPAGMSQKKILGSYDPNTRILAVVEPVHRPNPVRKGIIYLISLGICLLIWFLWQRRDEFTRNQ